MATGVVLIPTTVTNYCIAGKFGRELNLAVWRYAFQPQYKYV